MSDILDISKNIIRDSKKIVFFTGAGISEESGIPTFRDVDGIWSKYDPNEFGTWNKLISLILFNPSRSANFLFDFISPIARACPNIAHEAIAILAKRKDVNVITQNIDGLHQRGGISRVIELHGSLLESRHIWASSVCTHRTADLQDLSKRLQTQAQHGTDALRLLRCLKPFVRISLRGIWLPNLILFGQQLNQRVWQEACARLDESDTMVIVGTSLDVYPAARLLQQARVRKMNIIHIDARRKSSGDLSITGRSTDILPKICDIY